MSTVVSSLIFTRKDIAGNPHVEGYFLVEFRDARYTPGGESVDLSAYMRRIEFVQTQPVSGILDYEPRPSMTDYPGNAGSGRMTLHYLRSSIVTIHMSGLGIQILSGQSLALSGALISGQGVQSNTLLSVLFSGLLVAITSGSIAPGQIRTEILSGTAVSGTRAVIHALGT